MFAKVIQFLQDLGIVDKCEEEGWNDLSDKILQTLRVHFRRFVPFRFQPDHHVILGTARCLRQPINYTIGSQSESRTFPTNKDLRSSSLADGSINSPLNLSHIAT